MNHAPMGGATGRRLTIGSTRSTHPEHVPREGPIRRVPRPILAAALIVIAACWSRGNSGAADGIDSSRHVLYAAELQGAPYPSMLEAIQALRGEWLHKRGPTSFNNEREIVVYLDNNRIGGPASLRSISTMTVVVARFLPPTEAQSRFGLNHPNGAIVVQTKL